MGRRYHLLADGPAGSGADREDHAVRSRYRASDKGATGVCQLGAFGAASVGLSSPAMSIRRTPAESLHLGAGDAGREREDRRCHVPLHAGLHLAGNGREEWQFQPGGNVRSSGQRGNSHSRSGGDGAMAGKIGPAGRHLQTGGCIRYVGTPGHRRTAQPRSGHSGLLFDRPDSTSGAPADDTTQSRTATAHR